MPSRPDWESYFMTLAAVAATRSTCLRRQVGAVIVRDGQIISTGYNGSPKGTPHCSETGCLRSLLNIPSGERQEMCRGSHAEMNAIRKASKKLGDWRLEGCTIYVTLEPCQMCSGAIVQSRIDRCVIGAMNPKAGCAGSVMNLLQIAQFNHQVEITKGLEADEEVVIKGQTFLNDGAKVNIVSSK